MEKRTGSLRKRIIRALIIGAATLTGLVGVSASVFYAYIVMREYKKETNNAVNYAVSLLDEKYLKELYESTRTYYQNGFEKPGEDSFSEEYLTYLLENPVLLQEEFWEQREILAGCREKMDLEDLSLCFLDNEKNRLIIVLDGDREEDMYLPGNWLSSTDGVTIEQSLIDKVLHSSWRMKLDYGIISGWILANFVEVTTENGEVLGIALVNTNVSEVVRVFLGFIPGFLPGLLLIILILALLSNRYLKKQFVEPVLTLSRTAEEYIARDKAENEEETGFFKTLQLQTGDEIETLSDSLSKMEEDINDTMKRIRQIRSEKERINAELDLARKIQAGQLPRNFPAFPERRDFDIYASMMPAMEVAGDFYDFFLTDEHHIALVVADVSDKGVPAALLMMVAKNLLNAALKNGSTPAEAMNSVNQRLYENNEEMQFVTAWAALIDLRTGEGLSCNAGHEKPFLKRAGGNYRLLYYDHFSPLAVMEEREYRDRSFRLSPGDALFCYTDGVPEATNSDREMFGSGRTEKTLNRNAEADPKQIVENMDEEIRAFTAGAMQYDDITMLSFVYYG